MKCINRSNKIPKQAFKILDAPGLVDNFYMNILDWSAKNFIGISLQNEVFLWKNKSSYGEVVKLAELFNNVYCSIKFCTAGEHIACGTE